MSGTIGINRPPKIKVALTPELITPPVVVADRVDAGDCACGVLPNVEVKEFATPQSKNSKSKAGNSI